MTQPFINLQESTPTDDRLLVAIFVASLFHAGLILGTNFSVPEPPIINKSIEITLVNSPTKKAPKKADFLAQENQVGAGTKKEKSRPLQQKTPTQGATAKQSPAQKQTKSKPKADQKVISQKKSETKMNVADDSKTTVSKAKKKLTTEALSQQIAQLGVTVRNKQQNTKQSRIKFVNSVSAHKYKAAYYKKQWQEKVERIGNLNYPEVARQKGFSGKLRMDVGIKHDGSIYSIRIRESSGYKALDDAAIRIVRMGVPYAPLPKELRAELDVLVISRIWHFSDESGFQ